MSDRGRGTNSVEFVILGPTALTVDGRNVSLGTTKQRGLLALLLFHVGTPVRIETIVEHPWDRRAGDDYRPSIYALASRTRASLKAVGRPDALIRVQSTSAYRLDIDSDSVDYHRFRNVVRSARNAATQDHHDESVHLLTRAMELWRGEPVADLRGNPSENIRRSMNETYLAAHKLLADSQLRIGRYEAVLAQLEPVLRLHNLDESLARSWMSALHSAGRPDDARAFAIDFRQRFRKAMRVESSVEPLGTRRGEASSHPATGLDHLSPVEVTAPPGPPDQLPRDINDFTGRLELLSQIDDLTGGDASGASVVILGGMPGAGKTTLAAHWAHQHQHRFADGQLYLNADAYGPTPPVSPAEALARFLQALGVPADRIPAGLEQRRERFNQLVHNRRVLIVLDNILNSDQARPLIPASRNCVTLITSRNRLKSLAIREGARGLTVTPLSPEESLGLLSQVIGPDRAAREPLAARALAGLSGGLPLALRIIGEHVAERPLAKVVDLVDELTAHLLDYEGEDDQDASLRNVFAWSYRALDQPAARLFRLLGLFPGRNISAAVASVLLGADHVAAERILNTLARAHLVSHHTAARYRCHDLIRLYAEDRMRQEDSAEVQRATLRRILDWYVLTAANAVALLAPDRQPVPDLPPVADVEPLVFRTGTEAMAWCESERGNLHAVVRAGADHGFHRHAWQLPNTLHETFGRFGRQDDVLEIHQIALSAAVADGHQVAQMGTLNNLGGTSFAIHEYDRAARYFNAALELARQLHHPSAEAACSHNVASVHLQAGRAGTAIGIYQEVLGNLRDAGDLPRQGSTLHRLGDAYRQIGRHDTSAQYYREALEVRQRIGSLRGQAATHSQLAALHLASGQPHEALRHCALALDFQAAAKDDSTRCDCLTTRADAWLALGFHPKAWQDAREAIAIAEEIADSRREARALAVLAESLRAMGDLEGAWSQCDRALDIVGYVHDPQMQSMRDRLIAVRDALGPRWVAE